MKLQYVAGAAVMALGLGAAGAALAATFDALADFSATNNPNGAWTYGFGAGGQTFSPFTGEVDLTVSGNLINIWKNSAYPLVLKNNGPAPIAPGSGYWPTDALLIHPANGTDVIVRWTAPADGAYDYNGLFETTDQFATGVNTDIFANSQKIFGQALGKTPANTHTFTPGEVANFSGSVSLVAGDHLDFVVNTAGDQNFDSTGFEVKIDLSGPPPPPIPAIATLSSTTVNFGAVRAGTANVIGKTTVTNTAVGFPVDHLNVTSATGLPADVSVSGALPAGLGSGQSGDVGFLLDTTNPGVVGGGATLSFTSTSTAESLDLPSQAISFTGTVTQLAQGVLVLDSGAGVLTGGGTSYSLDLGSIMVDSGVTTSDLGVLNDILSTAFSETLGGSFSSVPHHEGYSFSGAPFSGLAGGSTDTGNLLAFDSTGLKNGVYTDKITLDGLSSYPGLSDAKLGPIVLTVTASIFGAGAVPEPGTWTIMLAGLAGLGAAMRSRRRAAVTV
jgi:hypothetical protein